MVKESMLFMYFDRNCQEALAFYRLVFGADILEKTTYGEVGMTEIEDEKPLVMNATFKIGGMKFCANDVLEGPPAIGDQLSVWLEFEGERSLQAAFRHFQKPECKVISALEETFWNAMYAKVQDPFGMMWELNFQK